MKKEIKTFKFNLRIKDKNNGEIISLEKTENLEIYLKYDKIAKLVNEDEVIQFDKDGKRYNVILGNVELERTLWRDKLRGVEKLRVAPNSPYELCRSEKEVEILDT